MRAKGNSNQERVLTCIIHVHSNFTLLLFFPNSTEPALDRRWEVSLEGRNGSGRLKVSGGPASLEGVFRPSYGG